MPTMAPQLKHTFTMRGYMDKEHSHHLDNVMDGPSRIIVPMYEGTIKGEGFEATIMPGGADWILFDKKTKVAHLDVRTQAKTADGHSVYTHYSGVLKQDDKANKVLQWADDAKTTEYGDHHWFSGPIFETSDPKFKWIEDALWIGQGRFIVDEKGSAIEYHIYQVIN